MYEHYLILLGVLYGISFILGLFVSYKNLRVNYSRKILSIAFFLIASLTLTQPYIEDTWVRIALSLGTPMIWILSFLEPLRKQSRFLSICFSSFDRVEDRPYTIIWLSTAMVVGYLILLLMIEWLRLYNATHLIFITVFVSTFGDGLAEPIGIKYGRLKYKTHALFTKTKFHRTVEGSACVALSAISGTIALMNEMTLLQFIAMIILMPICMTIAEAKSPHTWDNPFLHLVGGLVTILCLQL